MAAPCARIAAVPADSAPCVPSPYAALPPAPLWRRLVALIYDGLLLLAMAFAYAAAVLLVEVWLLGAREARVGHWRGIEGLWLALYYAGLWAWLSLYYLWCWRRSGQTLGMKTWRLRLQQADGGLATRRQGWLRCLLAPLSLASLIGWLWCLWSPAGASLHDLGSGTRMVVLPRQG
jgi:uncharacterized RDD family membrane protein YckC